MASGPAPPHGIPPPAHEPTSFAEYFAATSNDPYGGDYAAAMNTFAIATGGVGWDPNVVASKVLTTEPMGFIMLVNHPSEEPGRIRFFHTGKYFPTRLGHPTPYDSKAYVFMDDVVGGMINTATWPSNAFVSMPRSGASASSMYILKDFATTKAALDADSTLEVLPEQANGADTKSVRVPSIMWVPNAYVSLVIGKYLTPRQLFETICQKIVDDGKEADMEPFIDWVTVALTAKSSTDDYSCLRRHDLSVPYGTEDFLKWRRHVMVSIIPGVVGTTPSTATAMIATLMGDVVTQAREARQEAKDARIKASAPKSVAEYFKAHGSMKIMEYCNVPSETDLPDMWTLVAANSGKRERELIESQVRQVAADDDQDDLAPIITPDLAKKVTTLRFAGSNMDDLMEGINPFSMIVQDHSAPDGGRAYLDALATSHDFDDLMGGSAAAGLTDIQALKSTTKVQIPTSYMAARSQLQAFVILLKAIFGMTQPEVANLHNFVVRYSNKESFYIGRLQQADPNLGPARLLRFVQLQFRAWCHEMDVAHTATARAAITSPNYKEALRKMQVGDMSWLPVMPHNFIPKAPPKITTGETDKTQDSGKAKSVQVRNMHMNTRFDDFKTGIAQTKFNDAIKKVGNPPDVTRGGATIPMCASYHLRGVCFSNCKRKADHAAHTPDEDNKLYEWAKRAFE